MSLLISLPACGAGGEAPVVLGDAPPPLEATYEPSGPVGGPFSGSPDSVTILNSGSEPIAYEITCDQAWVAWSTASSGTLPSGESVVVGLSVDAAAAPQTVGAHAATVLVQEPTTGSRHATISVTLTIQAPPPPPPPPPTGGPMTTAHRVTGVAPLGVFFDAADTTTPSWQSGVFQPANGKYGACHYEWDFGDTASGQWSTSGKSRNTATGVTAAHVFHAPGVYNVALKITDPATGNEYNYVQAITVTAFAGTTYYVDAVSGNDSNNGLTQATAWKTIDYAFSRIQSNVRLLFKRGQTFTPLVNQGLYVTAQGPGIIGAYGTGARPIVAYQGSTSGVRLTSDWRVMDLDFNGQQAPGQNAAVNFKADIASNNNLMWNVSARDTNVAFAWSHAQPIYGAPHRGNIVAECTGTNLKNMGMYVGGRQMAIIGTNITGTQDQHVLRIWQGHKCVISHSVIRSPGVKSVHAVKLHGPDHGTGRLPTQFVTITDSVFGGGGWSVTIGPQNPGRDERVDQVLFERNRTEPHSETEIDLVIWARNVTVRNNVFVGTGAASNLYVATLVDQRGVEPAAKFVDVINNTVYRQDANSKVYMVRIRGGSDMMIRNNLGSAPQAGSSGAIDGSCPALTSSNNSLTDTPGFVDPSEDDFHLTASSSAVDAGMEVDQVRWDFDRKRRTSGSAPDQGAFER